MQFHSQLAQDQWVLDRLNQKERGFFIEIGAYDGVYHSNTLTLEQLGWKGILIEADREASKQATQNRQAFVEHCTVSDRIGRGEFFIAQTWSGLKRFARTDILRGHSQLKNELKTVPTVTLSSVLCKHQIPPIVDYLSIDVEGAEYAILRSYFNHSVRQFRCMTIEVGTNQEDLGALITLLNPLGYRLDKIVDWEAFFINPELL